MDNLELVARGLVEGVLQGSHRSPYLGHSLEFDSHRQYHHGDDLRHINWNLYARSKKLFIKQFRAETELKLYITLDTSASMKTRRENANKWKYAVRLASAMAWLAVRMGDAPALFLYDETLHEWVPPRSSKNQFFDIIDTLAKTTPANKSSNKEAFRGAFDLIKRKGVVVWISDFFDDDESTLSLLSQLCAFGHDVLAIQVLDPWEIELPKSGAYEFIDLESNERKKVDVGALRELYQQRVNEWRTRFEQHSQSIGCDFLTFNSSESLVDNLTKYLLKRLEKAPR